MLYVITSFLLENNICVITADQVEGEPLSLSLPPNFSLYVVTVISLWEIKKKVEGEAAAATADQVQMLLFMY